MQILSKSLTSCLIPIISSNAIFASKHPNFLMTFSFILKIASIRSYQSPTGIEDTSSSIEIYKLLAFLPAKYHAWKAKKRIIAKDMPRQPIPPYKKSKEANL